MAQKNETFKAVLEQVEVSLRSGRLDEAKALLKQAEKQVDDLANSDLFTHYQFLERDERTARQLEEIFEERWMVSPKAIWLDVDLANRRYPPLFETYGLDPGKGQPDPLAAIVCQAVISDRLTSALTDTGSLPTQSIRDF